MLDEAKQWNVCLSEEEDVHAFRVVNKIGLDSRDVQLSPSLIPPVLIALPTKKQAPPLSAWWR